MWSVLAHPEKMLKAARGCLWWTLIVTLQTLTSCLETLHHFISYTGLTREETKLSAEAGRFTRQVLIHNKPNLQVNMLHWQLLTFSHQHSARISGNLQRWNWFLGACEEKCEPIPNQERRERGREAERQSVEREERAGRWWLDSLRCLKGINGRNREEQG